MEFDDVLKLGREELDDLFYDRIGYKLIQEPIPVYQKRWTTTWEVIYMHVESGRFLRYTYERGSTEQQDMDREDMLFDVVEVFPRAVTMTVYEEEKE